MNRVMCVIFSFLLLGLGNKAFAQMEDYSFKKSLQNTEKGWNKLILSEEVYGSLNKQQSDLRIFGITTDSDTIEAPYLLEKYHREYEVREASFDMLNQTQNAEGYFYTFHIKSGEVVNEMNLSVDQTNFDWRVAVEGSHDQKEWFNILEDYRILSIQNSASNYQFTSLYFANAKYAYLRLKVKADEAPKNLKAYLKLQEKPSHTFTSFDASVLDAEKPKDGKQIIDILLEDKVPVSRMLLGVKDEIDYYRSFSIQYAVDSFETKKGMQYRYRDLYSGTLSSVEAKIFDFTPTITDRLRIQIENGDNQALTVGTIGVKGLPYEMIFRIDKTADYYLTYGNSKARFPSYDIAYFKDKVPDDLQAIALGEAIAIPKEEKEEVKPIFEDQSWLWGVMMLIIVLLGWFTFKMINSTSKK